MKGEVKGSKITLTFEPWNFDRLYSPDGKQHLLLCDDCKTPQWVDTLVDAVVCSGCANAAEAMQAADDAAWRRG
jgi:hypothetical protein